MLALHDPIRWYELLLNPVSLPVLLVVLGGLAIATWFVVGTWRDENRFKRVQNRQCIKCNYDLRGSGETCPECGTLNPTPWHPTA